MNSRQKYKNNWSIFWLICLAVLIVFYKPVYDVVSNMVRPVMIISSNISNGLDDSYLYTKNKSELITLIKSKDYELEQLKAEQMRFKLIEDVNNHLLNELDRLDFNSLPPLKTSATVISRPPNSPYDTLVIDKGINNGILEGDFVTSFGLYIGKIISPKSNTSSVLLISSPSSETSVFVASSTYTMKGLGGGSMVIEVPKGHSIEVGDPVSLADVSNLMTIGSIKHIESKDQDPFDRVFVSLPISLSSIRFIEIYEAPSI